MINNRLITQGLSTTSKNTLVAHGFATGIVAVIVDTTRRLIRGGRSSAKRAYEYVEDRVEEVLIYARLMMTNNEEQDTLLKGTTRVSFNKTRKLNVEVSQPKAMPKSAESEIVITIKRIDSK